MLLYRIRKIGTHEYFMSFYGISWNGKPYFNSTGALWKRPDTVWINLKKLCSDHKLVKNKWGFFDDSFTGFDPDKLAMYEVVISNVTCNGQDVKSACDFVDVEKLSKFKIKD